jgi:hypothetical protein
MEQKNQTLTDKLISDQIHHSNKVGDKENKAFWQPEDGEIII